MAKSAKLLDREKSQKACQNTVGEKPRGSWCDDHGVTEFRDRRGWSQSRLTSLMWSCTEADYDQHKCHAAIADFLGLTPGPAEPSERVSVSADAKNLSTFRSDGQCSLCGPEIQE